ncbi:MAG: hypothetical protein JKY13_00545, partial [Gammaproteobacteria bacterium]|nr:hypothetical protein [Gammaproteobacteria bacterium]
MYTNIVGKYLLRGPYNTPISQGLNVYDGAHLQHFKQDLQINPQAFADFTTLELSGCYETLDNLDFLKHLPHLKTLNLSGCSKIKHWKGLKCLSQLKTLSLYGCKQIQDVNFLNARLPQLEELDLGKTSIKNAQSLRHFTHLKLLDLHNCKNFEDGKDLRHLTQLKQLHMTYCNNLRDWHFLKQLPQLTSLWTMESKHVNYGDFLSQLNQLNELFVGDSHDDIMAHAIKRRYRLIAVCADAYDNKKSILMQGQYNQQCAPSIETAQLIALKQTIQHRCFQHSS